MFYCIAIVDKYFFPILIDVELISFLLWDNYYDNATKDFNVIDILLFASPTFFWY